MATLRTNIELDQAKLERAKKITGLKTTKETVDFALDRLSRTTAALEGLFRLSGKVRFRKNYHYKKER